MTTPDPTTSYPRLERHADVYVLGLGDGENRFHPDWIAAVNDALDQVEQAGGNRALVTTATGKFFSNGLDLDWLGTHGDQHHDYIRSVETLFARILSLPLVSVTAIQGHAFAAGAMLTLTHDFRVMRADRGFWCLPEIDLNLRFTPGMSALITARLTPQTAHEAMLTGRRYGGTDAHRAGIVEHTTPEADLVSTAIERAGAHATKAGATLAAIKTAIYARTLKALTDPS